MNEYGFKQVDFDSPSFWFVLEDKLKWLLGGPFLYDPYFKTYGLKGNERVHTIKRQMIVQFGGGYSLIL